MSIYLRLIYAGMQFDGNILPKAQHALSWVHIWLPPKPTTCMLLTIQVPPVSNVGIMLIGPLGINFSEILIEICTNFGTATEDKFCSMTTVSFQCSGAPVKGLSGTSHLCFLHADRWLGIFMPGYYHLLANSSYANHISQGKYMNRQTFKLNMDDWVHILAILWMLYNVI